MSIQLLTINGEKKKTIYYCEVKLKKKNVNRSKRQKKEVVGSCLLPKTIKKKKRREKGNTSIGHNMNFFFVSS